MWLEEYYNKIQSGEIVAGIEIKTALNRLMQDLKNPKYVYETKDADKRIYFIEHYCKHTKSPFYGKPFKLELWEKAMIEAAYSFKYTETEFRRFKEVLLLIARKNGKTTLIAAILLAEFFCGKGGTDVVCASNTTDQASIVFEEMQNMISQSPKLEKRVFMSMRRIQHKKNKNKVKKLSGQTKNKDGYNIEVGCIDEEHEMKTDDVEDAIKRSQSTKDEPLLFGITTEGFIPDGFLDKKLKYVRKVLNGEIEDESILALLFTQDNETEIWRDKKTWQKSNPSLGTIKKVSYIEKEILKSQNDRGNRIKMLCKDFNIKQNSSNAWLEEAEIINPDTFDMKLLENSVALGGVDLSDTTDLTCATLLIMKKGDRRKYIIQKYFMPKEQLEKRVREDKVPYNEWARMGLMEISEGWENDYKKVTKWFVDMFKTYHIRPMYIGYDKWSAKYWVEEMKDVGFDMETIAQKKEILSNPMKILEADLRAKIVNYNNSPILKWCLGNTEIKVDDNGLIAPVKLNSQKYIRIDGAVSLIIAFSVLYAHRNEYMEVIK